MRPNGNQLPINRPLASVHSNNQDGAANSGNTKTNVNYEPSSATGSLKDNADYSYSTRPLTGTTQQRPTKKTLNFRQAGEKFRDFSKEDQDHLIATFGGTLAGVKDEGVKTRMAAFAYKADTAYGTGVATAAGLDVAKVKAVADKLAE